MPIHDALVDIVGADRVTNNPAELFVYSRDSGAQPPGRADFVVLPKTAAEISKILRLANREKIPVTPVGAGLTLSGIVVPERGGIVLDMKRMDRILEVDELNRYVVIEAGVSQGALQAYLKKNHPRFQHSTPEAPPTATVTANALIHGHGHISPRYGINSDMIAGMEVVLPSGEITRIGACALKGKWFSRGPLPDLAGLFVGWYGTTGIVTRISLKLFPKAAFRQVIVFQTDDIDLLPEAIAEIMYLDMAEDFFLIMQEKPDWMNHAFLVVILSGHFEEELEFKKTAYKRLFSDFKGGDCISFVSDLHPALEKRFLDVPPLAALAADFRKGGGFQYTGAILSVDQVPAAWRKGIEIAHRYGMVCSYVHQVLMGNSIMFGFNYSFNRADEADIEKARRALEESNRATLDLGGMIWKGEKSAQQMVLAKMEPNTAALIRRVQEFLDPNRIMNPGKWEV
ncbi:FAD-binding oxidoreductase [uncultured Desulfosarcina sp.]|uniref:FAD-binding oxidoreductase n=1 Tax=uncultured Desulfosarcina sp. TaxID=218289 RepID=UPI0029C74055|nr:FAD-binding oxidoreductase [uncultured Desulfosarcina sp.]